MNTLDVVAARRAAGKQPSSLWRTGNGQIELRFADGEIITLPGTAVGAKAINEHLDGDYRAAISLLAKIVVECGWETSRRDAKAFLRQYHIVVGRPTQIYPL